METKQSPKDMLLESLQKKELVKPNKTEQRLAQEVESLCDFVCTGNFARGQGDTNGSEDNILF